MRDKDRRRQLSQKLIYAAAAIKMDLPPAQLDGQERRYTLQAKAAGLDYLAALLEHHDPYTSIPEDMIPWQDSVPWRGRVERRPPPSISMFAEMAG
jgi:transposase